MKEYTILSVSSVFVVLFLDKLTKINILRSRFFYFFFVLILFFKFLVNGYLTGAGIVIYDNRFYLGFRFGSIPLEDFLFGFSMVAMTIIFWEYFKTRK